MGLPSENPDGYERSSVAGKAAAIKAKLLLVHNFGDDNVHFQNTLQMSNALQLAGKQFETMIYPQKTHAVTGALKKQMLEGLTQFFENNLK
jgi:dipeptidyl-peptidase-4